MDRTWWHKQTVDKPLSPDLLWSRPENRSQAGKLLVVGGNLHGFAAAAEAYGEAEKAGAGTVRVLLPDSLQKTVSKVFPAAEYASSTPSGSFGQQALAELLDLSAWADGVLLAGDFGKNSETAILLEKFVEKCPHKLTIVQDAIDYFVARPQQLLGREDTTLVLDFAQLQRIGTASHLTKAFTSTMDFLQLVDSLHELSQVYRAAVIVNHVDTTFTALGGQVSTTKPAAGHTTEQAAHAAVWWLQNPTQPFEALSASLLPVLS